MEIKIINIEEANIKSIRKVCRKWKYRKEGATIIDIICETHLNYDVVKETLDWMYHMGDLMIIHRYDSNEPRYKA